MKKILLLGLASCLYLSSYSQEEGLFNPILTAVPSLGIAPDAIGGGMGDIGVATTPDIVSQYWNSSKYAMAKSVGGFAINYTPWLRKIAPDISLSSIAGYYQMGEVQGTLSASLRYFSLGQINLYDYTGANQGVGKPYEMAFDLGYSRKLSEDFSIGVALRLITANLGATTDENLKTGVGFSADINGFYQKPIEVSTGESKLGVGFNISNIGTKISYDGGNTSNFIPTNLRLGVSYLFPFNKFNRLMFGVEANKMLVPTRWSKNASDKTTNMYTDREYSDISVVKGIFSSFADAPGGFSEELKEINLSVGAEYAYNEQFFVRAGYHHENQRKGNRKFFNFGAGFKWTAFRFDVGYVLAATPTNPLDQTLRFTLSFDVDGLKELTDNK